MYRQWQCHYALNVHIPGSRCRHNNERHCRSSHTLLCMPVSMLIQCDQNTP